MNQLWIARDISELPEQANGLFYYSPIIRVGCIDGTGVTPIMPLKVTFLVCLGGHEGVPDYLPLYSCQGCQ